MDELNPAQRQAVTTIDGPVLVIAGAGSGKTRVIEYRVRHMVSLGIAPQSILLLTFTRRAAHEMLERAAKHDGRCSAVEGGTFHSFSYRLLKRYGAAIGFPTVFTVIDESDAEEAIKKCALELGLFGAQEHAPKKETLRAILSMSVNKREAIASILEREYPAFAHLAPAIEKLALAYTEFKRAMRSVDYDDLLSCAAAIATQPAIQEELGRQYRYVMVDEYQDTNIMQGALTAALGARHRNVMVVGDDAQSIYGFRGASHENIMEFPKQFAGCAVIKLEANYRSTQRILDLANGVLEDMRYRYAKCLTSARLVAGVPPRLFHFRDAFSEAVWIVEVISDLLRRGIPLNEQAVLFRSVYISTILQAALGQRRIPYRVYGGLKFYETAHAKDMIAHLKVLLNGRDAISWERVLTALKGIGPKIASRIIEEVIRSGERWEMMLAALNRYSADNEAVGSLVALLSVLTKDHLSIAEQFNMVLAYYKKIGEAKFDDWHTRLGDLDALGQLVKTYSSLEELVADLTIETPGRVVAGDRSQGPREQTLTLSTIHSAKGLEWGHVFLLGLMDGILPVGHALADEDAIEEERRLFYVAVTRAKEELIMLTHQEDARGNFHNPSRFLESPNVHIEPEMPRSLRQGLAAGFAGADDAGEDQVITLDADEPYAGAALKHKRSVINADAIFPF